MFYHKDLTVSRLERNQIIVLHWLTFLYSKKEKQQYKTERALLKDTRLLFKYEVLQMWANIARLDLDVDARVNFDLTRTTGKTILQLAA